MNQMAWTVNAKSDTEAEVLLYDDIAQYWGKSAKDFVSDIRELGNVVSITVRINSRGGSVWEAQTMHNYLRTHKAHKTVRIDGIAASAASIVAMAGDKIIMPSNALMMIHNPWTVALGESSELLKAVEVLDRIRDSMAAVYAARTGLKFEEIKAIMDDETWMNAEEALSMGFCDEVDEAIEIAARAQNLVDGDVIWRTSAGEARFSRELAAKMPAAAQKIRLILTEPGREAVIPARTPQGSIKPKEESVLDIKNVADLEKTYPALVNEIRSAEMEAGMKTGAQAERERLKALDSLAGPGREALIAKAKYEEPKDARDIAMELLQADKNAGELEERKQDASAIKGVLPPTSGGPTGKEQEEAVQSKMADEIDRLRGYKK